MSHSKTSSTASPARDTGRRRWGRGQWDHVLDPYKRAQKLSDPTVCRDCGAVYHEGRWQWLPRPAGAESTLCQACQRIADRYPAGTVTFAGSLVAAHRDEMIRLARHQEAAEKPEHPLNRIMAIEQAAPDRLVITTTDIHLPRRIGEAVKRAFHGDLAVHFDEQGYSVRIDWQCEA